LRKDGIDVEALKRVAVALGPLNDEVVYVGGGVLPLYVDSKAAPLARPTYDIDICLQIASRKHLEDIRQNLTKLGFQQRASTDVTCRFWLDDVMVDVMSTRSIDWAPGDQWYELGWSQAFAVDLGGVWIRLLPLPFYLASKLSAFVDRPREDARLSKHFEDIVYLIDNRDDLVDQVLESSSEVITFLKAQFVRMLTEPNLHEAIRSHLEPSTQEERYALFLQTLKRLADS